MEKIIGMSNQIGEYEGFKYNNYILYAQYDPMDKGKGICIHQYKIKSKYMANVLIKNLGKSDEDPYKLIGYSINNPYDDIFYDMQKQIKMINLIQVK